MEANHGSFHLKTTKEKKKKKERKETPLIRKLARNQNERKKPENADDAKLFPLAPTFYFWVVRMRQVFFLLFLIFIFFRLFFRMFWYRFLVRTTSLQSLDCGTLIELANWDRLTFKLKTSAID